MTWALDLAARTLAQEARNQPPDGQNAVAWVIRNRLSDGRWGHSLAEVCLYHAAFSGWWCPRGNPPYHDPNFAYACGLSDFDPMLIHMRTVMQAALDATVDPTNGAMWYHADSIPAPAWVTGAVPCGKFGSQLFFKGIK